MSALSGEAAGEDEAAAAEGGASASGGNASPPAPLYACKVRQADEHMTGVKLDDFHTKLQARLELFGAV